MTTILVRPARWRELEAMVDLIDHRRAEYERYQPVFWKRAARSRSWTRLFYRWLLFRRAATVLVAESAGRVVGMLMARRIKVPPVIDPGGATLFIDDFCIAAGQDWSTVGTALLNDIRTRTRQAGFRQIVIVCGAQDAEKTAFLQSTDLALASTWWTAIT